MTANREFLFRVFFRLRVHESHGDAFQKLFSSVMEYADPRFESIVPWGDWGDGGNDGWIEEDGHYFQVYGPKPTTKDAETTALKKAIDDYNKLPKKWKDIRRFTFVFNDRFGGTPGPIASVLQTLRIEKALDHAGAHSMKLLLADFMNLSEDQRQDILGGDVPGDEIEFVNAAAISDILTNLVVLANAKPYLLDEAAPDFERKIEFNGISPRVGSRLRSASYQVSVVDDFLETLDAGTRQALAQQMQGYYSDSKDSIPNSEEAPDERYFWLMERLVPVERHVSSKLAYRAAAELVLAKYFETCDAYEHPDRIAAP